MPALWTEWLRGGMPVVRHACIVYGVSAGRHACIVYGMAAGAACFSAQGLVDLVIFLPEGFECSRECCSCKWHV